MRRSFLFLLLEVSFLIDLIVQLLLFPIIKLSFSPFHAIFELSNIIWWVIHSEPPITIMFILLPFSLILHIEFVVNLHSSSLLDPVDPFSSVEVAIRVEHRSSAIGNAVEFFSLVSVGPCDSTAEHGLSLRVDWEDSRRSVDLSGGSLAFGLSWEELGLFGDLCFAGSWAVFATAQSEKKHNVKIWQGLWGIIIIMDVCLINQKWGRIIIALNMNMGKDLAVWLHFLRSNADRFYIIRPFHPTSLSSRLNPSQPQHSISLQPYFPFPSPKQKCYSPSIQLL